MKRSIGIEPDERVLHAQRIDDMDEAVGVAEIIEKKLSASSLTLAIEMIAAVGGADAVVALGILVAPGVALAGACATLEGLTVEGDAADAVAVQDDLSAPYASRPELS